jgi:hypothetical protein
MTRPKLKTKVATRSAARKIGKSKSRIRSASLSSKSAVRPDTKHARIIAMLRAPRWHNDCCHHDCDGDGMATALGSRLSCWCRPQEARSQSSFRTNRQRASLSHQGRKGVIHHRRSCEADGVIRCWRSAAAVEPRPKPRLETRLRICAVSISKGFVHDGKACFREYRPIICRGICCPQSSPIGYKPIALAIWITRPGRFSIERTQRRPASRCPDVLSASIRSGPN